MTSASMGDLLFTYPSPSLCSWLLQGQGSQIHDRNIADNDQKARVALFSSLRKVPGPWYAPWTNLVLKLQVIKGTRLHYIHAMHMGYG